MFVGSGECLGERGTKIGHLLCLCLIVLPFRIRLQFVYYPPFVHFDDHTNFHNGPPATTPTTNYCLSRPRLAKAEQVQLVEGDQ